MDANSTVTSNTYNTASSIVTARQTKEVSNVKNISNSVTTTSDAIEEYVGNENFLSVSDKAIALAVDHINKVIDNTNIELLYSFHKLTNTIIIKMRDKNTDEIIKEIPPEKVLDNFVRRMQILGLYVDTRG